ncbi:MAG: C10 family peptidase [Desulfatitalea sp.]
MMRNKSHSNPSKNRVLRAIQNLLFYCLLVALWVAPAAADPVDLAMARRVAENTLRHHIALYGDWNGTVAPVVGQGQAVIFKASHVAYNFQVLPSGHVLVAVDDLFSPVLLYSPNSVFDPARAERPEAIESWIVPEVHRHVRALTEYRRASNANSRSVGDTAVRARIAAAWAYYAEPRGNDSSQRGASLVSNAEERSLSRGATVGPLLSTAWGQGTPFNLETPNDTCASGHTLTGCVATAWAQLMRYWSWPVVGTGSHSYEWIDGNDDNHTLTVDFNFAYDWANMPATLDGSSSQAQKDAVSLLMYHVGVAAEMDFGCDVSSSSVWVDDVFDIYFGYQAEMAYYGPDNLSSSERFALLKSELDADPPRPVILSIFTTDGFSGHEVVVDGYQTTPTDMVHINYGWEAFYDGFYNIGSDFTTGSYEWDADTHHIVVGIAPDNQSPVVDAGSDQNVEEATAVQLSGNATDPENVGISSYRWTQTSGTTVALSDAASATPTFTTPSVHAQTTLVFQLRANDINRAFAVDTCTITVANTDGSSAPAPSSGGGGGGGGGCFIATLAPDPTH